MKFLLEVFLYITAPLVFLFIPKGWDRMPKGSFLRFYEDYNYGLNGDDQWVNPTLSDHPPTKEAAREWKWRVKWSHRNANTYDHEQGMDTRTIVKLTCSGDARTRNRPSPAHSGEVHIECIDHTGKVFTCDYKVKQWGSSGRCLRSYKGYKLMDILDFYLRHKTLDPKKMDDENLRRIAAKVNSVNPLMGFDA